MTAEEKLAKSKPILDNFFRILENRLASGCKYAAGTRQMTIADIMLFQIGVGYVRNDCHFDEGVKQYAQECASKCPNVKRWAGNMMEEFKGFLDAKKPSPF